MVPNRSKIYCCDADSLFNLQKAQLLDRLRQVVQRGQIRIPDAIYQEIPQHTELGPRIANWHSSHNIVVEVGQDPIAMSHLPRISRAYGEPFTLGGLSYAGFFAGGKKPKSKDPQLMSIAKARNWVVVSNDKCVAAACVLDSVRCINWEAFAFEVSLLR